MGILKQKKGNPSPKCAHCRGTGRVQAPWIVNRNVRQPAGRHKATKRIACPSCGGTGYG